MVGKKVAQNLPDYDSILNQIIQSKGRESITAQINGEERTVFTAKTANDCYTILRYKLRRLAAEKVAEVRESALRLSDMLDNLFSFSTIVTDAKKKEAAEESDGELSKVSYYSRAGIMAVLTSAMVFAYGISLKATVSGGYTKMSREVS